ncbi:hypothetical protein, partial [Brachyspira sp. G79]|uniref:hypothetical protein n=1 Tax=Brachyspira sp. G79 TaxID=1358104 RepID=UPI00143CA4F7
YDYSGKKSNEVITKLLSSHALWIYNRALIHNSLSTKKEYYTNIFYNVIEDLINYGAVNKKLFLFYLKNIIKDKNMLEWYQTRPDQTLN